MSSAVRNAWVLLVFLAGAGFVWGAPSAEENAFDAAARHFRDHSWERAERGFADFRNTHPQSEKISEALFYQAGALVELKKFSDAIELLNSGLTNAGPWRDEYLFTRSEAQFRSGAFQPAAEQFAQFIVEFPNSPRVLEALLREAEARGRLNQWERIVDLLRRPDGLFQSQAKAEPARAEVVRGRLLLADALLKLERVGESEAALAALADVKLEPELFLQKEFLMARIHLAGGHAEQALAVVTNLPALATNQPAFAADALELAGQIHEHLGHADEAIRSWLQILTLPVAARRHESAEVRAAELLLRLNRDAEAIRILENILVVTNSPASAVTWFTLGELRLRSFMAANVAGGTNGTVAVATNLLPQALVAFETVTVRFTNSVYAGKAQLGLGWCQWLGGNFAECRVAFQMAARSLTNSMDRAVALFKLGDVLAAQKDFSAALASYKAVAALADNSPEVRTNLAERALYQVVQTAREAGDVASANAAMSNLMNQFPNGFLAEKSLMSRGGTPGRDGDSSTARAVFEGFVNGATDSPLVPVAQLAIVRTYEEERDWLKAKSAYSQWLETHTNHPARPRAEYFRALATARSGGETNALQLFTEFAARYPTNEFVPLAQLWIADHFWRQEDFVNAELNYQQLAGNHPGSSLRFEALLRAGRAAVARDNPLTAISYFTNLTGDVNCPAKEDAQALFATGDCYMSLKAEGTNQARTNFNEAILRFHHVTQKYPGTEIGVLAQGRMGDCYWNLGEDENAKTNYNAVLTNSMADATARFQAMFGLGMIEERTGAAMTGPNEAAYFLKRALEKYETIIHQEDETLDTTWVKRAGLQSLSIAEKLQDWEKVASLCNTLGRMLPTERANLEKKKARAEQAQAAAKALE